MQKISQMIAKIAPTPISVLLHGESGTGKELLAKALHAQSERHSGPMVTINCAAIPENLLESELFGFEKGAFTGAYQSTQGKIEKAHRGTLFLDEIGDLPLALQPKLLRFLQEKTVERLGGGKPQKVDVRIICATHQDLAARMAQQLFREDLYYRLTEITLNVPPLRSRAEDGVLIAKQLLDNLAVKYKTLKKHFTEQAISAIYQYAWPGNVRELENKVKRALLLSEGSYITPLDLDLPHPNEAIALNLKQIRDQAEKQAIIQAMALCKGNVSKAASLLGITRPTLYNIMEKLQLSDHLVT